MTARQVATAWMQLRQRWLRNTCMRNFTPPGWFECDIIEVTKAGMFREYEIKLTRSDFKADAAKTGHWWRNKIGNKHEAMASNADVGPSQFWFITPVGLLKPEDRELAWAGFIEFEEYRGRACRFREVKVAPRLHRKKRPELLTAIHRASYYRLHTTLQKHKL